MREGDRKDGTATDAVQSGNVSKSKLLMHASYFARVSGPLLSSRIAGRARSKRAESDSIALILSIIFDLSLPMRAGVHDRRTRGSRGFDICMIAPAPTLPELLNKSGSKTYDGRSDEIFLPLEGPSRGYRVLSPYLRRSPTIACRVIVAFIDLV